jgi:methylmalonyl-CoA/ethylmalonyl-CoA epimerase
MDHRLLDEDHIAQLCFVTDDVQKSARWFSELTGKPVPDEIVSHNAATIPVTYHGKPATPTYRIIIFEFGNIAVEFVQPGPEKSAWRDVLETKGPGFHHFAINTRNMTKRGAYLEGQGLRLLQRGEFDDRSGSYAYYDASAQLGTMIELLESNDRREPQP